MSGRVCSVEGCPKAVQARDWCQTHYRRWNRHGDPTAIIRARSLCSIDGCEKGCHGRGWCKKHYYRWSRTGDPTFLFRPGKLDLEGAVARWVTEPDECWPWPGKLMREGYGRVARPAGTSDLAHRVVYELLVGPIPEGLTLDHLCRNRACVNPAHLEPVTGRVNILRGQSPPAVNARKTHCVHGHPFDEANTYVWGGKRSCRACAERAAAKQVAS